MLNVTNFFRSYQGLAFIESYKSILIIVHSMHVILYESFQNTANSKAAERPARLEDGM